MQQSLIFRCNGLGVNAIRKRHSPHERASGTAPCTRDAGRHGREGSQGLQPIREKAFMILDGTLPSTERIAAGTPPVGLRARTGGR